MAVRTKHKANVETAGIEKVSETAGIEKVSEITLAAVAEATLSPSGFAFTSPAFHEKLAQDGLVEVNKEIFNEFGQFATRITEKGISALTGAAPDPETPQIASKSFDDFEQQNTKSSRFVIEENIPLPTAKRTGRSGHSYPFDEMQPGQSFFVPESDKMPNPMKSLAPTVVGATARYAVPDPSGEMKRNRKGNMVPVMIESRKFVIRAVEEKGKRGARIWRVY